MSNKVGACMVVGAGIGGMQASLDLANSGIKVYLADSKPSIGGVMAQLDKTFPTNDCAMCTMAPRLVEISRHNDIEIITFVDIDKIEGKPGNFTVTLKKRPRFVDEDKCTGCGSCILVCPLGKIKSSGNGDKKLKPISDEFNVGLSNRSAIYISYPQAIPNVATIDKEHCIYLLNGKCGACKKVCSANAINFEQKELIIKLNVGAVILCPGYELFDAKLKPDYGFGKFQNVITSLQFERILSASGPFSGKVIRPSDKNTPKRIAFIQCVGSRDFERDYCSVVCCMYATKEAIIAKEHISDLQCDIFFMDIRAFSKGFEEYYNRAKKSGINYIRTRIPSVKEIDKTKNLVIEYLTPDDRKLSKEYELVVLSAGLRPSKFSNEIAFKFGISLNEYGFCSTDSFTPVNSSREGIFVAGTFTEPKDIPETVTHASAAASNVLSLLSDDTWTLTTYKEYPVEKDVKTLEPRIGVFVCHCGKNIGGVANVPEIVEYAKTLSNVVHAEDNLYMCSTEATEKIKQRIKEHDLNRVVVGSCTPRTHEPLFRSVIREAGLNEYLFEMANIRDQCTWVHMHEPEKATKKAKDLIRIAVVKARLLEPLQRKKVSINRDVLVIGAGLSGMAGALSLADQGFKVFLIEKEKELGGNLRKLYYLLNGNNPQEYLKNLIEKVKQNKNIHLFTNVKISSIDGFIGNFKTEIIVDDKKVEIEHGAIIVATGAKEYKPAEYMYGKDIRVITQLELEKRLAKNWTPGVESSGSSKNIVMIQCVGLRDENRLYCARICCSQAVKNALKIKKINPNSNIFILYRDMRTYGFNEGYYTKARQNGIVFAIYNEDKKPVVIDNNNNLSVKYFDATIEKNIVIDTDLVVLSSSIIPYPENKELAQMLKVPLDQNGFFLEAHMKLRPVDFSTDGIFLAGLAHFPKSINESISQTKAVAARIGAILSKDSMELEGTLSEVIDENCDGCAYCIDPCPYKAITLIEYIFDGSVKKTVEVNESKCKGCGVCQATCPKKGIFVRGFKLEQIAAMVNAALQP